MAHHLKKQNQHQHQQSKTIVKEDKKDKKQKKPYNDEEELFETANDTETESDVEIENDDIKQKQEKIKRNTEIEFRLLFGKNTVEDWNKEEGDIKLKFFRITNPKQSKTFVNNFINREYPFNYEIQEDHIKVLVETIKQTQHLFSPITVIQYTEQPDKIFMLIDAHHRIRALNQIYQNEPDFKIQLEVYVYLSDTIESETTQMIFNICNRVKISSRDEKKIKLCSEVSHELKKLYGAIIKTKTENDTERANRPNFHVNKLNKGIEGLIRHNPDIKCSEIIEGIVKYNNLLSIEPIEKLLNKNSIELQDVKIYEKAKLHNFYIGLHPTILLSKMWKHQFNNI